MSYHRTCCCGCPGESPGCHCCDEIPRLAWIFPGITGTGQGSGHDNPGYSYEETIEADFEWANPGRGVSTPVTLSTSQSRTFTTGDPTGCTELEFNDGNWFRIEDISQHPFDNGFFWQDTKRLIEVANDDDAGTLNNTPIGASLRDDWPLTGNPVRIYGSPFGVPVLNFVFGTGPDFANLQNFMRMSVFWRPIAIKGDGTFRSIPEGNNLIIFDYLVRDRNNVTFIDERINVTDTLPPGLVATATGTPEDITLHTSFTREDFFPAGSNESNASLFAKINFDWTVRIKCLAQQNPDLCTFDSADLIDYSNEIGVDFCDLCPDDPSCTGGGP